MHEVLYMNILKSAVFAFCLAFSLGAFTTTAVACERGKTCIDPIDGINTVLGHITEAIAAIDADAGKDVIQGHIKQAKKKSKEISANDKVERSRIRANGFLKKARSAIKKDDTQKAKELLGEAEKAFADLKKLI